MAGDEPEYTPAIDDGSDSVVAARGVVADGFRGVHGHGLGVHGLRGDGEGEAGDGERAREGEGHGQGHGQGQGQGQGQGLGQGGGEVLRPQQVLLANGRRGLVV